MNLESAAQSLTTQFPSSNNKDLTKREERMEKFGRLAFIGFLNVLVLAVAGLLYAIVGRFIMSGDNPYLGILMMAFIIFAVLTLGYVLFREDLKDRRKKQLRDEGYRAPERSADTTRLIDEKHFEPVSAVTENTPDLLPVRNRNQG